MIDQALTRARAPAIPGCPQMRRRHHPGAPLTWKVQASAV